MWVVKIRYFWDVVEKGEVVFKMNFIYQVSGVHGGVLLERRIENGGMI